MIQQNYILLAICNLYIIYLLLVYQYGNYLEAQKQAEINKS